MKQFEVIQQIRAWGRLEKPGHCLTSSGLWQGLWQGRLRFLTVVMLCRNYQIFIQILHNSWSKLLRLSVENTLQMSQLNSHLLPALKASFSFIISFSQLQCPWKVFLAFSSQSSQLKNFFFKLENKSSNFQKAHRKPSKRA